MKQGKVCFVLLFGYNLIDAMHINYRYPPMEVLEANYAGLEPVYFQNLRYFLRVLSVCPRHPKAWFPCQI